MIYKERQSYLFVSPSGFWKHSSPLPISALCNSNPDFLDQANITVFMFFLSDKVSFENSFTFVHKIRESWCKCPDAQSSRLFFVMDEKKAYRGFI